MIRFEQMFFENGMKTYIGTYNLMSMRLIYNFDRPSLEILSIAPGFKKIQQNLQLAAYLSEQS